MAQSIPNVPIPRASIRSIGHLPFFFGKAAEIFPPPLEAGRFIQKPHGEALKKRANATPGENNKIAFSST